MAIFGREMALPSAPRVGLCSRAIGRCRGQGRRGITAWFHTAFRRLQTAWRRVRIRARSVGTKNRFASGPERIFLVVSYRRPCHFSHRTFSAVDPCDAKGLLFLFSRSRRPCVFYVSYGEFLPAAYKSNSATVGFLRAIWWWPSYFTISASIGVIRAFWEDR